MDKWGLFERQVRIETQRRSSFDIFVVELTVVLIACLSVCAVRYDFSWALVS